jgi:TnpA family transposase
MMFDLIDALTNKGIHVMGGRHIESTIERCIIVGNQSNHAIQNSDVLTFEDTQSVVDDMHVLNTNTMVGTIINKRCMGTVVMDGRGTECAGHSDQIMMHHTLDG